MKILNLNMIIILDQIVSLDQMILILIQVMVSMIHLVLNPVMLLHNTDFPSPAPHDDDGDLSSEEERPSDNKKGKRENLKSVGTEEVERDKKQKDLLQHNLKGMFYQYKKKTETEIKHNSKAENKDEEGEDPCTVHVTTHHKKT